MGESARGGLCKVIRGGHGSQETEELRCSMGHAVDRTPPGSMAGKEGCAAGTRLLSGGGAKGPPPSPGLTLQHSSHGRQDFPGQLAPHSLSSQGTANGGHTKESPEHNTHHFLISRDCWLHVHLFQNPGGGVNIRSRAIPRIK